MGNKSPSLELAEKIIDFYGLTNLAPTKKRQVQSKDVESDKEKGEGQSVAPL